MEGAWVVIFLVLFLVVAIYCSVLARRVERLAAQVRQLTGSPADPRTVPDQRGT